MSERTRLERLSAAKKDLDHKYDLVAVVQAEIERLYAERNAMTADIDERIRRHENSLREAQAAFEVSLNKLAKS